MPEQQLDQLRLDFAVSGLPASGRMGFEIFDSTQFGATEFLEQVNYRRALEGELARTIATHLRGRQRPRAHRHGEGFAVRDSASSRPRRRWCSSSEVESAAGAQHGRRASPRSWRPRSKDCVPRRSSSWTPSAVRSRDRAATTTQPLGGAAARSASSGSSSEIADAGRQPARARGRAEARVRANVAARFHADTEDQIEERWDADAGRPQPVPSRWRDPAARASPRAWPARARTCRAGAARGERAAAAHARRPQRGDSRRPPVRTHGDQELRDRQDRHATPFVPRGGIARLSVAVLVDDER